MPISIKEVIKELGHEASTLKDEDQLGIKNGEVAELSIKKQAVIVTLDSDFLSLRKNLQKQSKVIYVKIHPRNPKKIASLIQKHLHEATGNLENPGKAIISEKGVTFYSPWDSHPGPQFMSYDFDRFRF